MDHIHAGFQMPMAAPPLMNQPPQIFGGYTEHGMPIHHLPPDLVGAPMFDHGLLEDSNEAKRRRIARVRDIEKTTSRESFVVLTGFFAHRLVTCAERRRSSVMENYLHARIVSTTRMNAYSHRWKRRGTLLRGKSSSFCHVRRQGSNIKALHGLAGRNISKVSRIDWVAWSIY